MIILNYQVEVNIMSSVYKIEPKYYRSSKGKGDLISVFSNGPLMTHDEAVGFLKGNIFKYVTRYKDKNGEEDLLKAKEYLKRLMAVEYPRTDEEDEEV